MNKVESDTEAFQVNTRFRGQESLKNQANKSAIAHIYHLNIVS